MNFVAFVLLVSAAIFCKTCVDATICKPLSTFKIDCDECQCSEDGTEYSCTVRQCRPTSFRADDDAYVLGNSRVDPRNTKIEIPYVNDEIPASRERMNNEFEDLNYYAEGDSDDNEDDDSKESIKFVGLEDASVFDSGLPDSYRTKRYANPHGERYIKPFRR